MKLAIASVSYADSREFSEFMVVDDLQILSKNRFLCVQDMGR